MRKRIEEIFGWTKTTGCFRKSRYRGVERTHAHGQYVVAAWNLVRMAKLMGSGPPQTARACRPPGPRCVRTPRFGPKTLRAVPRTARKPRGGACGYGENHEIDRALYQNGPFFSSLLGRR